MQLKIKKLDPLLSGNELKVVWTRWLKVVPWCSLGQTGRWTHLRIALSARGGWKPSSSTLKWTRWDVCQDFLNLIAPKASAEGACIWTEVGYCRACMLGYYDCAWWVTIMCVWWVVRIHPWIVYEGLLWRMGYCCIWVIRASGNFGCSVPFFDSCRLL